MNIKCFKHHNVCDSESQTSVYIDSRCLWKGGSIWFVMGIKKEKEHIFLEKKKDIKKL